VADEFDEFALIEWMRSRVRPHPRLTLGIGDDTASIRFPEPTDCLLTVDMLMEGVHFTFPPHSPYQVGRKALAVNLSDIAAMAGRPLAVVSSIVCPSDRNSQLAQELHTGLQELADEFNVAVAGGDTNTWQGPLVISVTLLGETTQGAAVYRSGARVGDWIMTTGSFGGSLSGKHTEFQPRINEAVELHKTVSLHAMLDVSDGLAADLHHLLDESDVGAVLSADAIPISDIASNLTDGRTPLEHALGDGEDFELLFCVSSQDGQKLLAEPPFDVPLSHIGEIVPSGTREIVDAIGNRQPLPRAGWKHLFGEK